VHYVRFFLQLAVANEISASHLESVAGHADDSLDKILRRIKRPLKDDDVTPLRRPDCRQLDLGERDFSAINHLVDEQEVSYEERTLHAARRNLESFDKEGANDEKERECNGDGAEPFPDESEKSRPSPIRATQRSFSAPFRKAHSLDSVSLVRCSKIIVDLRPLQRSGKVGVADFGL
jgi:hypothetical protein